MDRISHAFARMSLATVVAGALVSCGGGGGAPAPATPAPVGPSVPVVPATYLLGGSVSGLADGAAVTVSNGGDSVAVAANGSFTLPTRLAAGAAYSITSSTPPGHTCSVGDGAGTMAAADTNKIAVKCTAFLLAGEAHFFNAPTAAASDASGASFVLDSNEQVIYRIGANGVKSLFAGTFNVPGHQDGPGTSATFFTSSMSKMVFDLQGNLILADSCNGLIRKIAPDGVVSTLAGKLHVNCGPSDEAVTQLDPVDGPAASAVFSRPNRLAVDPNGGIVVSDALDTRLRRISAAGVVSTEDPLAAVKGRNVQGLAFNKSGVLFIAGSTAGAMRRIWRIDGGNAVALAGSEMYPPPGPITPALQTRLSAIDGMVVDANGDLYFNSVPTVRKLSTAGVLSTFAGSPESFKTVDGVGAAASFSQIADLTLAADGKLLLVESNTKQLRTVTAAAVVTTMAATPTLAVYADGKGGAARFYGADTLASAADGSIYTIDAGRHVVRKVAPDGSVSLFAGVVGKSGISDGPLASATLTAPVNLTVDSAGAVYIVDSVGVRKIAGGVVSTIRLPSNVTYSQYLRVLPNGMLVSAGSATVTLMAADGAFKAAIGRTEIAAALGQGADERRASIAAIEVDSAGNLFIADSATGVVFKYSAAGVLTPFAGSAGKWAAADGAYGSGSLSFDGFGDMTIDGAGNLYLSGQGKIRKISPQGMLSTPVLAWGNPHVYGITARNGLLYGSFAAGIMQTPLP